MLRLYILFFLINLSVSSFSIDTLLLKNKIDSLETVSIELKSLKFSEDYFYNQNTIYIKNLIGIVNRENSTFYYDEINSNDKTILNKNDQLKVIGYENTSYYKALYKKRIGFILKGSVTILYPIEFYEFYNDSLNVRLSNIKLEVNSIITNLKENQGSYRISNVVTTSNKENIPSYREANTLSPVFKPIPKKAKICILNKEDGFWKIKFKLDTCYIKSQYITENKEVKEVLENLKILKEYEKTTISELQKVDKKNIQVINEKNYLTSNHQNHINYIEFRINEFNTLIDSLILAEKRNEILNRISNANREQVAYQNIIFGLTKEECEIIGEDWDYKDFSYNGYKFYIEKQFNHKGKVYMLSIRSSTYTATYYETEVENSYEALTELFTKKYGFSNISSSIVYYNMNPGYIQFGQIWNIGDKTIKVGIGEVYDGYEYYTVAWIYSEKMNKELDSEYKKYKEIKNEDVIDDF